MTHLLPCRRSVITALLLGWCVAALSVALLPARPLYAQELRLYRVGFTDPADLATLATTLDVWEVDHIERTVLAPLSAETAAALAASRRVELATDQSPLHPILEPFPSVSQASGIPGFACYRTVEETAAALEQLAADAPDLARLVTIGQSWERAGGAPGAGYDLQALVVTNRHRPGPKPAFVLIGAIHARELTTAETALRFAEHLISRYDTDPIATWLLDHAELHVIPIANPDGRKKAETGLLWRKNTNASAGPCTFYGTVGVDLNRNSSFQWNSCLGCSSGFACSEVYRGVAPASEPETRALEAYIRSVLPARRPTDFTSPSPPDTAGLLISLHSYGELILFPWGWSSSPSPNRTGLETLARKLAYPLGYRACQAGADNCLYQTDGTTDDWAYGELGIAAFTYELGTRFFQSCTDFEESIYPPALDSLRTAFLHAAQPYRLAAGPESVALTVTTALTAAHISLVADATRYMPGDLPLGEEPVTAARVALNAAPWDPAQPTWSLSLAGGEPALYAQLDTTLDTTCLPGGRHLLVAQAQNRAGDWGAPIAQFITLTNTAPLVATLNDSRAPSGVGVIHTLHITNTGDRDLTLHLTALHSPWAISFLDDVIGPLAPGATTMTAVIVQAPTQTTGAAAPVGVELRVEDDPDVCLQVVGTTRVDPWQLHFPLVMQTSP